MKRIILLNIALLCLISAPAVSAADKDKSVTMEYYYKIKWGHQDDFIELYKKNHLPLLNRLVKAGYMLSVNTVRPILHSSEDRRWDYRVTIVFRDADAALSEPPEEWEQAKLQLYPDQKTFKEEEIRRFEFVEAHWDVAITKVVLE